MFEQNTSEPAFSPEDIDDMIALINRRRVLKRPVFHYTTPSFLMQILASGEIQPRTRLTNNSSERPVAYFTFDPVWEPLVYKSPITASEYYTQKLGMARIGIANRGLLKWGELVRAAQIETDAPRGGFDTSDATRAGSSVQLWLGSLDPVDLERWKMIQVVRNRQWVPLSGYAELTALVEAEMNTREQHEILKNDPMAYFEAHRRKDEILKAGRAA
jgi:hypothetical protein